MFNLALIQMTVIGGAAIRGTYVVEAKEILYMDVEPLSRPAQGTGWDPTRAH